MFILLAPKVRGWLLAMGIGSPEQTLRQAIVDMQVDLVEARQAVLQSLSDFIHQKYKYNQTIILSQECEKKSNIAIKNGEPILAQEFLSLMDKQAESATTLKVELDRQSLQTETLKKKMSTLENKISELRNQLSMVMPPRPPVTCFVQNVDPSSVKNDYELDPDPELQALWQSMNGDRVEATFERLERVGDLRANSFNRVKGKLDEIENLHLNKNNADPKKFDEEIEQLKAQIKIEDFED